MPRLLYVRQAPAAAIARPSGIERVIAVSRVGDDKAAAASVAEVVTWLGRVAAPA